MNLFEHISRHQIFQLGSSCITSVALARAEFWQIRIIEAHKRVPVGKSLPANRQLDFFQSLSNLLCWCSWSLVSGSLLFIIFFQPGFCLKLTSSSRAHALWALYRDLFPQPTPGTRCEVWAVLLCHVLCPRGTSVPGSRSHIKQAQDSPNFPHKKLWPSTPKVVVFFHVSARAFLLLSLLPEQSFSRNQCLSVASGCYRRRGLGWMLELRSALTAEFVPKYHEPLYLHQSLNQRFLLHLWRNLPSGIHAHSTRSLAAA